MRRWNGWGDDANEMQLPSAAATFLQQLIGQGHVLDEISLAAMIGKVPPSRVAEHRLLDTSAEQRVRHAKGQSLPDWLAMHSGEVDIFPDAVAFPENHQDVVELLAFAKQHQIALIPYGGGTSVAGHINPVTHQNGVVTVAMTKMDQLTAFDSQSQLATFGAGTPGPMVEAQLRAKGYMLGHFPQSFELSTLGGWIASRSSGQQSLGYGRIEQLFAGGNMATFDGDFNLPCFPASSAGPDLRELVLGSEGRLGILTDVVMRVSKLPECEQFQVVFFPNWQQAQAFCQYVVQQHISLSMLRVSNATETDTQLKLAGHEQAIAWLKRYLALRGCNQQMCMLTLGVTGTKQQVRASNKQLKAAIKRFNGVNTGTTLGKRWQQNRFKLPYLRQALWQLGYVVDTLETATNWDNAEQLMAKVETAIKQAVPELNGKVHVFTHLSHVYQQGCSLYTSYVYPNSKSYSQTLAHWQQLKHAASTTIVDNNATISHQHGVGKDHAPYLAKEKGELGMRFLANTCKQFDPDGLLNPKTLIDN